MRRWGGVVEKGRVREGVGFGWGGKRVVGKILLER